MSELQIKSRFNRRPSFWKTPITRNPLQILGRKRNYSQITQDGITNTNTNTNTNNRYKARSNPNKKRRLLTNSEIESMAKCGGFNPSNILIAVQESDGFCWFKRAQKSASNQDIKVHKEKYLEKYSNLNIIAAKNKQNKEMNENVLRELSKDELKKRKQRQPSKNPNELNKEKAQKAMERAAKSRRHTAPIHVLQKLIDENNKKEKELMIKNQKETKKKKKKKKKKKVVIGYKEKEEVIRKKVKKIKRVLHKKKTRSKKIKIITEFACMDIPDFPIPNLRLSSIFYSILDKPYIAIRNFELSLIESFVIPLTAVYAEQTEFSFIARNVVQFLMEIRKNISNIVNCIDFQVIDIPINSSIIIAQNQHKLKPLTLTSPSPSSHQPQNKDDHRRLKTPNIENEDNLNDEYKFYENQFLILDEFCKSIQEEIQFTTNTQQQLQTDEYLTNIFDFDLNDGDYDYHHKQFNDDDNLVLNAHQFINQIASEIDEIYSEYAWDFHEIECEQKRFENELNQRKLKQLELTKLYMNDDKLKNKNNMRLDEMNINNHTKDKMIFSNFIKANKHNDFLEDDTLSNIGYLRNFDGYIMNENDTLMIDNINDIIANANINVTE